MRKILFGILLLSHVAAYSAQINLPKIFCDSMVLQQKMHIPIWGTAEPGTPIVAQLGRSIVRVQTDPTGNWKLRFPAFKAGGPYTLSISEAGKPSSTIELKGILIGDVWLASGQSNMDMSVQQVQHAQDEISNANYPPIRFFVVGQDVKLTPQNEVFSGKWKVVNPNNVKDVSAVAYFFARKIHLDRNVPIGIVQTSRGGTPVEAWTSREMLLSSPLSKARVLGNDTLTPNHLIQDSLSWIRIWNIVYQPQNQVDKIVSATTYDDSGWPTIEMPRLLKDFGIGNYEGMMWMRKKVVLPEEAVGKDLTISIGHPEMCYSLYFNGMEICRSVWNSNSTHSYRIPGNLVRKGDNTISLRVAMLWGGGGINPPASDLYLTDGTTTHSLAGAWLYQKGLEPAFPKICNYQYNPTVLYNAMVHPLIPFGIKGFLWYQGEANDSAAYNYRTLFPMMIRDWRNRWGQGNLPFLFVQLANYKNTKPVPAESEWAELREAQAMTLAQPNTGMACIIDIGLGDNIHPTNKQEVGRRLALVAQQQVYHQNIIASGPTFKSYHIVGNEIHIQFSHIGKGLKTSDGKALTGFALAGEDKRFHWAKASIKGNEVIVSSNELNKPVAARYAWADNPNCNLTNSAGLPAVPFRTDSWKGITQK